mmetsp:Transcript_17675/g.53906  ORF Transcript_17675/g.53906 Transcript_17675/m.53906 type:complete len:564 (+) Transcript_17675:2750-4441(+)
MRVRRRHRESVLRFPLRRFLQSKVDDVVHVPDARDHDVVRTGHVRSGRLSPQRRRRLDCSKVVVEKTMVFALPTRGPGRRHRPRQPELVVRGERVVRAAAELEAAHRQRLVARDGAVLGLDDLQLRPRHSPRRARPPPSSQLRRLRRSSSSSSCSRRTTRVVLFRSSSSSVQRRRIRRRRRRRSRPVVVLFVFFLVVFFLVVVVGVVFVLDDGDGWVCRRFVLGEAVARGADADVSGLDVRQHGGEVGAVVTEAVAAAAAMMSAAHEREGPGAGAAGGDGAVGRPERGRRPGRGVAGAERGGGNQAREGAAPVDALGDARGFEDEGLLGGQEFEAVRALRRDPVAARQQLRGAARAAVRERPEGGVAHDDPVQRDLAVQPVTLRRRRRRRQRSGGVDDGRRRRRRETQSARGGVDDFVGEEPEGEGARTLAAEFLHGGGPELEAAAGPVEQVEGADDRRLNSGQDRVGLVAFRRRESPVVLGGGLRDELRRLAEVGEVGVLRRRLLRELLQQQPVPRHALHRRDEKAGQVQAAAPAVQRAGPRERRVRSIARRRRAPRLPMHV